MAKSKFPSDFQKMVNTAKALGAASPILGLLARTGIDGDKMRSIQSQLNDIVEQAEELTELPPRFSKAFSALGWVFSESIPLEDTKSALELAEKGDLEAAEDALCSSYEDDRLSYLATMLRQTPTFKERYWQLQEAVMLTHRQRFIASIPLLLIIADGVGMDYFKKSIFSDGVDVNELGSLAGQPDALPSLIKNMCRTRRALNTDEIQFPYRNGILHGRDLNYGNRFVNAKCWAFLINISDVIRAREAAKYREPEPEPTLVEAIESLSRTRKRSAEIEAFQPRPTFEGTIDVLSDTASFQEGTPEFALSCFLKAWSKNNFGKMGQMTVYYDNRPINKRAGEIREMMDGFVLTGATIKRIKDKAAAVTEVLAEMSFEFQGNAGQSEFGFSLQSCNEAGEIRLPSEDGATWQVYPRYQGWAMQQRATKI